MIIQDVDEAYLYLSPAKVTQQPHFEDGSEIICTLWRDEDARYIFNSIIDLHGDVHAQWRIRHNKEKTNQTQDREHFRLRFEQTVTIGILNASLYENTANIKELLTPIVFQVAAL